MRRLKPCSGKRLAAHDQHSLVCLGCRPPTSYPECPADLCLQESTDEVSSGPQSPISVLGHDTASEGDRWARQQLAVDGEEVTGKVQLPQYLLLARTLLTAPLGESHLVLRSSALWQGILTADSAVRILPAVLARKCQHYTLCTD